MSLTYPIKLEPVTTLGEDEADAIEHARDAIEEAIAARWPMVGKFQSRKASLGFWSPCRCKHR